MLLPTVRAFSLDDEGDGMGVETSGELKTWYLDVFHAKGTLARLTVEVDVPIMMVAFAFLFAQLIVEDATAVLKGM